MRLDRRIRAKFSKLQMNPDYISYWGLGENGRLGNQLWQIFSTIGLGQIHDLEPIFPKWKYEDAFSFPRNFFVETRPTKSIESPLLAQHLKSQSIYLQDLSLIRSLSAVIESWTKPSDHFEVELGKNQQFYDLANRHAIHVRRGDYVNLSNYHSLPNAKWYEMQMRPNSLIFTDDEGWCSQHFPGVEVFQGGEISAFHAMSNCSSFTISASSFSWWAAVISNSDEVTYPEPWAQVSLRKWNTKLFIPEYFVGLKFES